MKIKKFITYLLITALITGKSEQIYFLVQGKEKVSGIDMEEILEEIPKNEQGSDYIIMKNGGGSFDEPFEKVKMTEQTAEKIQEKYEEVIVEKDISLTANKKAEKENSKAKLYDRFKKAEAKAKKEREKNKGNEWSIKAVNAEDIVTDNESTIKPKIAVLDSGVDIVSGIHLSGSVNLIEEEKEVSPMFIDFTGHGTGIASIIAGNSEGNVQGINPNAEIYSVKVLDGENKAPLSRIIEGIYWCIENDMAVINMSFGTAVYSVALEKAVSDAYQANILMVSASGNNADDVEYPAAFKEVMAVAATNTASEISSFSNMGDEVDIAAPGEKIKAAGFFNGSVVTHGTSIAVPYVVGVASVLWEKDMTKSNEFIRQLMINSSKNIENSEDCGLMDAQNAFDMYERFSESFDEKKGTAEEALPENTAQPETFEYINHDGAYAEGRWNYNPHLQIVNDGKNSSGITDIKIINIIKEGAVYPDNLNSGWDNRVGYNNEWHGIHTSQGIEANYLAIYELVTKIALKYGNTSSFTNYTQIKGINSIIYSWIVGEINTTYIGDKYWSSILTTAKYGKDANTNADNKKYFLWGCALHILSDMFAHGTKIKSNSKVGAEITHTTRADDATYVRNRYDVAVKAVDYSLAYMTMNIPGDYWDVIYALMDKYNNTFAKIKLLDFVNKSSGGGLSNTYLSPVQRASCNP